MMEPGEPNAHQPLPPRGTCLRGRYELGPFLVEREGVARFLGVDRGEAGTGSLPIIVVCAAAPEASPRETVMERPSSVDKSPADDEDIWPTFDETTAVSGPATAILPVRPAWPSIAWEKELLEGNRHPSLPAILDRFATGGREFLVEEVPNGTPFWDAWDQPEITWERRCEWLKQIAGALQQLYLTGSAFFESLHPGLVVVSPDGTARLKDLTGLVPAPLPDDWAPRGNHYTAPEVLRNAERVDARAGIFGFGALLYALSSGANWRTRISKAPVSRYRSSHNFRMRTRCSGGS